MDLRAPTLRKRQLAYRRSPGGAFRHHQYDARNSLHVIPPQPPKQLEQVACTKIESLS